MFASSGRACGYPNARYDWDRVLPALRQYPNGKFFILTPQEKREWETRFSAWNQAGGQPMRMMAPCFNCSPEYELCIVFDRPNRGPSQPPTNWSEVFASNGSDTPPGSGGDSFASNSDRTPPADGGGNIPCTKSFTECFGHPRSPTPERPTVEEKQCQPKSSDDSYIAGFQQGFASCLVGLIQTPIALASLILMDAGDQARAAQALLQGDTEGAAEILQLKGERNRQQLEQFAKAFNPNVIGVDSRENGRRVGERICQFLVVPQIVGKLATRKPGTPPKGASPQEPTTVPIALGSFTRDTIFRTLRVSFSEEFALTISELVDDIGQAAAKAAVEDSSFTSHLANKNFSAAGSLFHSYARQAALKMKARLPEGWKMYAEEIRFDGAGNEIRPDVYFRGPCNELIIFDWKTSGRSALRSIDQLDDYMGALSWHHNGGQVITAQSVSWADYVRPLMKPGKLGPLDKWR